AVPGRVRDAGVRPGHAAAAHRGRDQRRYRVAVRAVRAGQLLAVELAGPRGQVGAVQRGQPDLVHGLPARLAAHVRPVDRVRRVHRVRGDRDHRWGGDVPEAGRVAPGTAWHCPVRPLAVPGSARSGCGLAVRACGQGLILTTDHFWSWAWEY